MPQARLPALIGFSHFEAPFGLRGARRGAAARVLDRVAGGPGRRRMAFPFERSVADLFLFQFFCRLLIPLQRRISDLLTIAGLNSGCSTVGFGGFDIGIEPTMD